jgi:acyl-CoA thioesterase
MATHLDIRPLGEARPFGGGDEPVLMAWLRMRPAPAYRSAVAAVLLDGLVPSLYAVLTAPAVIPTVEFTVHFCPVQPTDEWFFIEQRTTWSTGSFCVDEAELRTTDGILVAQSRQLRRILGAPSAG